MSVEKNHAMQDDATLRAMLRDAGYSDKAADYYIRKPHIGRIDNADQISEMTGTCGDTIKVFLKVSDGRIADVKYQVMGCPGSISAAMAAGDLVRGKTVEEALALNDGDVFQSLGDIPAKKHHCIQLAVKALLNTIRDYRTENAASAQVLTAAVPTGRGLASNCCAMSHTASAGCGAEAGCCAKKDAN
jgi:nitrogen fixation NifU-like protein